MKTSFTNLGAKFIGTLMISGIAVASQAQGNAVSLTGTSYSQNFDALGTGVPAGWSVKQGNTASALGTNLANTHIDATNNNTLWNNTTGGLKNFASASAFPSISGMTNALQQQATNRALGVRQVGASDPGVAFIFEIANTANLNNFDLSFKLQSLDTSSPRVAKWIVDYGLGTAPTSFTSVPFTGVDSTGGRNYSNNTINVDFGTALDNHSGPVVIRIAALTNTVGTGNRPSTAIDDFELTWNGAASATNILATDFTPVGANVSLGTSEISVKYDNAIAKGTGNFNLVKVGTAAPVATIDVTSAGVSLVNDSTAVIDLGAYSLENNSSYFVHADAGVFTKVGGTLPSIVIADSNTWAFSTVDTTPIMPVTSLDETFASCQAGDGLANFTTFSETGSAVWACSRFGREGGTDSTAVYINGGSSSGSSTNMDWLITATPLDFSAMNQPALSFYQKKRFEGDVVRTIRISNNHVAGNNPNDATWTTLSIQDLDNAPAGSNAWTQIADVDLTPYKATPFYLAFTYSCGTTGAYELTYDDIKVTDLPTSIKNASKGNVGVNVLGEATRNQINLNVEFAAAGKFDIQLFDLLGRKVAEQSVNINAGANRVNLNNLSLNGGMYVVRIVGNQGFGTVKTVVK